MKTEFAKYQDGALHLTGMFAWQESTQAKRPGILVVHGASGLDDHPKGRAKQFAEWGYVSFACDLYGAGVLGDRERVRSVIDGLRREPQRLCRRATAGIELLLTEARACSLSCCRRGSCLCHLWQRSYSGCGLA